MRLLVDAHTVIWAVDDPSKLSPQAVTALQDPGNDLLLRKNRPTMSDLPKLPTSNLMSQLTVGVGKLGGTFFGFGYCR